MKKYFLLVCVFLQLFSFAENGYAASAVAGALEPTQILNNVELVGVNVSDAATAIFTGAEQIDSIIFRPLQTMLITIAQQQAADDILSWVNGGTQGNSLIISNPEKYMKNQGLGVVKQALNDIPSDSVFGDSIFSSLTSEYRDIDLGTQLANLSSSDEASIIQDSMCDDGTLTELAINAIADDNGNYSNADLTAEKTQLYNYACAGDPKKDPEVATRLADLGKQNASIGGWDRWLCTTGGNCNQYTQVTKARNVVAEKEKARQELISKEIFLGAGPVSQTNCLEYAPTANEDEEPVCIEYETLTPGKTVANSLNSAANSGLDRLTNLMEGGLTGLLTSLAISKLTGGVNAAIKASQSGSNTGSTVTTKAAPKQDLADDPSTKKSVTNPMTKMLDSNDETLTKVQNVDQEYLGEVTKYANDIDAGRACYDSLVDSGLKQVPPVDLRNDPKVIEAYAFYDDRQSKIEAAREKINAELNKIAEGKQLIANTKIKIANSNSTQEMSTIYDEFSAAYDDAKYPTLQTLGTRQGELSKGKSDIKGDKDNIDKYKNTCTQMGGNGGGTQDPSGA